MARSVSGDGVIVGMTLGWSEQGAEFAEAFGAEPEPRPLASLFAIEEAGVDQQREVMADGGLTAIERVGEIAGAHLAGGGGGDDRDEAETDGVGERFERGGEFGRLAVGERIPADRAAARGGVSGAVAASVGGRTAASMFVSTFIDSRR